MKSKIHDLETLSHVHVYYIEYVLYWQRLYGICSLLAMFLSNMYHIGKVRIKYVSYRLLTVSSQP